MNKYEGKVCRCGYKLEIMQSANGYYLGTNTEFGGPNCRVSYYYKTRKLAEENAYPCRDTSIEIMFCNKGSGCLPLGK